MTLIRFATLAPEGTTWMDAMRSLDAELRERSGGEVGFKFYPNMAMGDEQDVIRKMRLGQLHGAGFTGFGLGEILPEIRILELPYLFQNEGEIDCVKTALDAEIRTSFAEKGFIFLGWADVGWIYFYAKQPVVTPRDLSGVKAWAWAGDPLAAAFFAELGRSPVTLSITDVIMALQTKMVDAVYASPLACLALQWFTKLDYVSDVPFTNSVGAVLLDKKIFDELSPTNQSLLLEIAQKQTRRLVERTREDNRLAYAQLLKEGLKPAPSSPEQRCEMQAIGYKIHSQLAGKLYPQTLLDKVNNVLEQYRTRPHR